MGDEPKRSTRQRFAVENRRRRCRFVPAFLFLLHHFLRGCPEGAFLLLLGEALDVVVERVQVVKVQVDQRHRT